MALIDATDRFAARREAARRQSGQFGEQEHSAPEIGLAAELPATDTSYVQLFDQWEDAGNADLTTDDVINILSADGTADAEVIRREWEEWNAARQTPTLEQVFAEMNELGDLDEDLTAPEVDTYTGTQEQRDHDRRVRELNDLLGRAGIERDELSEKTLAEIQDGMLREEQQKASYAAYQARQAHLPDEDALPVPRTPDAVAARKAATQIIEARGSTLDEYHPESLQYLENWAREQIVNGTFDAAVAEEVARSKADRDERDAEDRNDQDIANGPLTDEVWDAAVAEDRLRAQQRIRKYRPTNYVNLKETNKIIRGELKDAFGTHKFSVVGDSYAGGSSTNIRYIDGPPEHEVKDVSGSFIGSTFDGMTDSKSYHDTPEFDADGIPVSTHYTFDHVFTRREFSDSVKSEAERFLIEAYAQQGETFDPTERGRYLNPPQALYNRAGEAQRETGVYGYSLRGGDQSAAEMVAIASTLIADERWAKRKK